MAFGGRIIGEGEPKYLNSVESPIFSKTGSRNDAASGINTKNGSSSSTTITLSAV